MNRTKQDGRVASFNISTKILKILVSLSLVLSIVIGSIKSLPKILENRFIQEKLYFNIHSALTRNLNECLKVITASIFLAFLFSAIFYSIYNRKKKLSVFILYCTSLIAISATANAISYLYPRIFSISVVTVLSLFISSSLLTLFLYHIYSSKYPLIRNSKLANALTATSIVLGITSLLIFLVLNIFIPSIIRQARKGKPNVILVTIDTLRANHLGCYGYRRNTSPFIDSFQKKSVLFTNAITPTPSTDPAHASIHTSLYPAKHGVLTNGWVLSERYLTLAEALQNEGYFTQALVSVYHLGSSFGFGQGFKDFDDNLGIKHSITPEEITNKAIQKSDDLKEPFYLWIHYWDPHSPYNPPEVHDIFKQPGHSKFSIYRSDPTGRFNKALTREDFDRIISLYDGEIHYTDSELQRLFDALGRKINLDNSMIIITADHGEIMDELARDYDYAFDHGEYLFDGNIRVPLIIQFPQRNHAGLVIDKQVSIMDIMPTVFNHLGKKYGKTDGHSLTRPIMGKNTESEFLFLQRRYKAENDLPVYPEFGIRTSDWKYILEEDSGTQQLFNLIKDPIEKVNLFYSKIEFAESLYKELTAWKQIVGKVAKQEISEKQKEILKSLGYIH